MISSRCENGGITCKPDHSYTYMQGDVNQETWVLYVHTYNCTYTEKYELHNCAHTRKQKAIHEGNTLTVTFIIIITGKIIGKMVEKRENMIEMLTSCTCKQVDRRE